MSGIRGAARIPEVEQPVMEWEERGADSDQSHEVSLTCDWAKRLLDEFGEAVQAVLLIHEQQFLAIVDGDSDANRFDLLIHDAIERKQNAKYAYLNHLDLHGCSS